MIKVNRYSDFTLQFKMADGKPLPQYPFSLIFQTAGGLRYYVDSEDKTLFVRSEDNMSAVVVFDFVEQKNLPAGELRYTLKASLPNTIFPDGYQDINEPQTTGVELWDGASDFADAIECELVLPYVKGDSGVGIPSGGASGQMLSKKSDADYDVEWVDAPQGGSKEWKCVVDRRMEVGEKNVEFTTFADGTPLKAKEAVVQVIVDGVAASLTGYVAINSTTNKTDSLYGVIYYNAAQVTGEGITFVNHIEFKASPFVMIPKLTSGKVAVAVGGVFTGPAGSVATPQVYEDIVAIKLRPNSSITAAPPIIKIYAR